jgi:hypothetical protein
MDTPLPDGSAASDAEAAPSSPTRNRGFRVFSLGRWPAAEYSFYFAPPMNAGARRVESSLLERRQSEPSLSAKAGFVQQSRGLKPSLFKGGERCGLTVKSFLKTPKDL